MYLTGFKYFVTFVDVFSRVTWFYLMNSRPELFSHFNAFCAEIQTQFQVIVQTLRSDNAKEYIITFSILHVTTWDSPSDFVR